MPLKITEVMPVTPNMLIDFTGAGTDTNVIPAKLEGGIVSIYTRTTDDDKVIELRMSSAMARIINKSLTRLLPA